MGLKHEPGYNRMAHRAVPENTIAFIRKNYLKYTNHELAKLAGVSESTVLKVRLKFKIKGKVNIGCFPKNNRPWSFRKKLEKSYGRMAETQFKKGGEPGNTLYDGAITVRLDHPKTRKGRPYKWIRISKGKWIHYHRYLWEKKYGPVPAKHMVAFKDGDTMNVRLRNLKLISMADNARRNYNPVKAQRALKSLSDRYIAGRLAGGDKKLREAIIKGAPELIKAKRSQLKLNRILKNERHNQARKAA